MAILDLSKVNSNQFLPEGETICTVKKVMDTKSKEKGTAMVEVELVDRLGRLDRINFVLSEKALFRIKSFALACGFPEEQMAKFDTSKLLGKKVLVIKTQKGMRTITTEQGPKEVKDYEHNFGPANFDSASDPKDLGGSASVSEDEIPF